MRVGKDRKQEDSIQSQEKTGDGEEIELIKEKLFGERKARRERRENKREIERKGERYGGKTIDTGKTKMSDR